ncbi:hypothetical protein EG835_09810, partial [bacterium]|nr:hypothetical protein [bacterium]
MNVDTTRAFAGRLFGVGLVTLAILVGGARLARAAKAEVLISNGVLVLLQDRLPDAPGPVGRIAVSQEIWDAPRIAQAFGQRVEQVDLPEAVGQNGEGSWLRLADGGLVRLGAAGAGFYATSRDSGDTTGTPAPSYDASRAVEIARGHVRDHGGLPHDAELWSVREVLAVELSLSEDPETAASSEEGSKRCVGHYVEFRHTVDGVPIDSPGGGDAIKVRVDSSGRVRAYGRVW